MRKVVRLTESDLERIIRRVIKEQRGRKPSQKTQETKIVDPSFITKNGDDYVVRNVPFVGNVIFRPSIIQWGGMKENPFFTDDNFKSVSYYLNKQDPNRNSKNKNTVILSMLFDQHPDLMNDQNLNMPLGKFVKYLKVNHPDRMIQLKRNSVPAYMALVNDAGGEDYYVSFKSDTLTNEKGLYMWELNGKPVYLGKASSGNGLLGRINNEYGKINPYMCSVDGQSQTCRSNRSIRDGFNSGNISLYVTPIDVDSLRNNPEFMDYMKSKGYEDFKDSTAIEVIESFIIDEGGFKDSAWNRRL